MLTRERESSAGTPQPAAPAKNTPMWLVPFAYVLRNSWLWACAVAVLATYVAVMLNRGAPWRGDATWTIDWLPISFVLAGPVVAGLVAVDTARLSVGIRDLPLRGWRGADTAVASVYCVALALLHLLFVAGILLVSQPPRIDTWAWLAVIAQLCMVGFFVAIGSLVGRYARVVLGGISAALLALACVYVFSTPRDPKAFLDAGAATVPRVGLAYDPVWLLKQIGALLLIVTAMTLVRPVWTRSRARLAVILAGAAVLVIAGLQLFATTDGSRLSSEPAPPDECGVIGDVPWCYYPEHERVVDYYGEALWALFDAAENNGYGALVPDRVEQASLTWVSEDPDTVAFVVSSDALAGDVPSFWEITAWMVEPVHCPQLQQDTPPADHYWEDVFALTATWAMLVDPATADEVGYYEPPIPPEEAGVLMTQLRTCTYAFH